MEKETTELVVLELNETIENKGLELSEAEQIKQSYLPFFVRMGKIKELEKKINFESPSELDEKIARELRLEMVDIRKRSEEVKDNRKRIHYLKASIEQDSWNLIKSTCFLEEERYLQVEKKREIAEKKRKEDLKSERLELLTEYTDQAQMYPLGEMSEDSFNDLLNGLKLAKEAKIEEERKVEEARLEKLRIEAEEKEKLRLENERLQAEAKENERLAQIEKKKQADALAKIEAEKKAEQERHDKLIAAQRKEAEKVKAEADSKLKKEREENERLAAELQAKKDAEEKAEKDRLAKLKAESDAKIKAEKEAAKAPDKDKLKAMVQSIQLPVPLTMSTDEGVRIQEEILTKLLGFKTWAEKQIEGM